MSRLMNATSSRPDPGSPRDPATGAPAFLWALVAVMAAIELVLSLSETGLFGAAGWRRFAIAAGAFWQPVLSGDMAPVYPGQGLLMFITYAFLHGGFVHLALNSVVLLSLGKFCSMRIGAGKTLLVLTLSAVGGALAFGVIGNNAVPMIGASGAVFGLIGLWQSWDYALRRQFGLPLQPVLMAVLGLIAANVVFFVILNGGLAWEAHLGGWLVGWLSGRILAGCSSERRGHG